MFAPFTPFWIRKPVPVLPSLQFPPSMHHHPSAHHPSHHQNFNTNFNLMNFRGNGHAMMAAHHGEKINSKKDFYDNTIQSIKTELLNNNTTISAKVLSGEEQNYNSIANSYEEDDYNNDNIDVETDSDTDQQIIELKQMSYHNLSDATVKHEEWSKVVKHTMLKSPKAVERLIASVNSDDGSTHPHDKKITEEIKIDANPDKCSPDPSTNLKRVYLPDEDDNEYFSDTFTSHNLLNLSDKKRGKYGNGTGFSIENLIGRMVEDR